MHDAQEPPRRGRGRPRVHPLPDPSAPKRRRGRPTKAESAAIAAAKAAAANPTSAAALSFPARTGASSAKRNQRPKPPSRPQLERTHYVIPSRASQARFHKYDALFRDQFHPNPGRRFFSFTGLGELLDYNKSTVSRDTTYLRAFHQLPIERFPERGGWGYTKLSPRLSGIWMEEGDLFIVAASWGALGGRPGSDLNPKVAKCMEKLLNVLGHDLAFDFKTVSERIAFRSSGYHSAIDVATFGTVTSAVLSQQELTFTYRKATPASDGAEPGPDTRLVQPRCMVCVDHSAWYILADDPALPDEVPHTFALFRMSEVADTGRKFEPGKPFNVEAVLQDSFDIHRGGSRKNRRAPLRSRSRRLRPGTLLAQHRAVRHCR